MRLTCGVVLFVLMISRTLLRCAVMFAFAGLTSSFPLYLLTFQPRKLNPSVICVTLVFSGESMSPRFPRNLISTGMTSCCSHSFELPVMTKSSAYRTMCIFRPCCLARGKAVASAFSRPSSVMFARTGLIIPPCGVPDSVGKSLLLNTNPALSHLRRIEVSTGMLSISH